MTVSTLLAITMPTVGFGARKFLPAGPQPVPGRAGRVAPSGFGQTDGPRADADRPYATVLGDENWQLLTD